MFKVRMIFAELEEDPDAIAAYYHRPTSNFVQKLHNSARDYLALAEESPTVYPPFSEMTDEQFAAFFKEYDLQIPAQLVDYNMKNALYSFETEEVLSFTYPLTTYYAYFEDIRYVFKMYYGIPDDSRSPTLLGKPRLSLMSEEECIRYFSEEDLTFVQSLINNNILDYYIWCYEQDPEHLNAAGSTNLQDFYDRTSIMVSEYYGMPLPEWFVY